MKAMDVWEYPYFMIYSVFHRKQADFRLYKYFKIVFALVQIWNDSIWPIHHTKHKG